MATFVDRVMLHVAAGKGGHGCASVHREKFKPGAGDLKQGANGADVVLPVPSGTVVKSADGEVLADLVGAGTRFVLAKGGPGGLGNAALATTKRKAPGFALLG